MQIQRGRPSFASRVTVPINARAERPEPPRELTDSEKELWRHLVRSRRPRWFDGSEALLQSYVISTIHCQALEARLRQATPSADAPYERLARLHCQAVKQCASLARTLRLTVSSRVDRNLRHDGDEPLMEMLDSHPGPNLRPVRDVGAGIEPRRFSDLLEQSRRRRGRATAASLAAHEMPDGVAPQSD
jgi:hypothetical protein